MAHDMLIDTHVSGASGASDTSFHAAARDKIRAELRAHGLQAYIAITPSNFYYTSGYNSSFLDLSWRMTGTDAIVISADPTQGDVMIVSDYMAPFAVKDTDITDIRTYSMWIEARDYDEMTGFGDTVVGARQTTRPEQYNHVELTTLMADVLKGFGCDGGRVATDLDYMQVETLRALQAASPNTEWIDAANFMYAIRAIKHPEEIARLRNATFVFEKMAERAFAGICEGYTLDQLRVECELGALLAISEDPSLGDYQGSWAFNAVGANGAQSVKEGSVVKVDAGVRLSGYYSDCARMAVFGKPDPRALHVYEAQLAGYEAAAAKLKPGNTLRDVFDAALSTVRANGFPNYSRGHFGHSIGMDDLIEEPPFIGANDTLLKPGMVLCLEVPYYPPSVGDFNIEDLWLITETGAECLNTSPRTLAYY